jgi:hypothetical protein
VEGAEASSTESDIDMGMLDSELIFASAQIPTDVGDTPSTNVYDTGSAAGNAQEAENWGTQENLWINAICNTAPTSGGTIQAVFQDSPDNATWTDRLAGAVKASAACLPGVALLQVQPPVGTQRYWRIVWRIATTAFAAGAFDAYVSNTIQYNVQRPSGFTVS